MYSGNQYGDLSARVGVYAVGQMLEYARNQLCLDMYARKETLPKNKSQTIKWRRLVPLSIVPNQLTEGVTPNPTQFEHEIVSDTISQYGDWMALTDVVQDTFEDPVLNDMVEVAAQQAAGVKEMILWGVLRAGTNVIYTGSATTRATVSSVIALDDVRAAVRELKANHANMITKRAGATDKVSTVGIPPCFVGFCHTNVEADLKDCAGFVSPEEYASGKLLNDNEIGKIDSVRFIATPHLEPFFGAGSSSTSGLLNTNSAVDVYPIVIVGREAYGSTTLSGMGDANISVINPGKVTKDDPLGQRGLVSWKFWFCATILNELWMVRIETAVRAL